LAFVYICVTQKPDDVVASWSANG